jgi:hypothetical protein
MHSRARARGVTVLFPESKFRESPAGFPALCTLDCSRFNPPLLAVGFVDLLVSGSPKVQEYAIDIIIHPVPHFNSFRDGGSILNQIQTSSFIQSQDGASIPAPPVRYLGSLSDA